MKKVYVLFLAALLLISSIPFQASMADQFTCTNKDVIGVWRPESIWIANTNPLVTRDADKDWDYSYYLFFFEDQTYLYVAVPDLLETQDIEEFRQSGKWSINNNQISVRNGWNSELNGDIQFNKEIFYNNAVIDFSTGGIPCFVKDYSNSSELLEISAAYSGMATGQLKLFDQGETDGIKWKRSPNNGGVLTFSGKGDIPEGGEWTKCPRQVRKTDIKNGITGIGPGCFAETLLKSIKIPNSVKTIGHHAFLRCLELNQFTVPKSVEYIGINAFGYCHSLTAIKVDSKNEYYTSEDGVLFSKDKSILVAFPAGRQDTSYVIPEGTTAIYGGAFAGCDNLESITIPDSVTEIGEEAFAGCHHLKDITIPNGVTVIRKKAFFGCNRLKNVDIPDSVSEIQDQAFFRCTSLKPDIPQSVKIIGEKAFASCNFKILKLRAGVSSIGKDAFIDNPFLTNIFVEKENARYYDNHGVLYDREQEELILFPSNKTDTEYEVVQGTRRIADHAFQNCKRLQSIILPDGVTEIGAHAFDYCRKLEDINFPDGLETIGSYAFYSCEVLGDIILPGSLTHIESNAFDGIKRDRSKYQNSIRIRAPRDSYAIQYARDQGIDCGYYIPPEER